MKTIDQKIAEKEAELAKLKQKSRSLENGQKIIAGSIVIEFAKKDQKTRTWLISKLKEIERPADKKRVEPLINELQSLNPVNPHASSSSFMSQYSSAPKDDIYVKPSMKDIIG